MADWANSVSVWRVSWLMLKTTLTLWGCVNIVLCCLSLFSPPDVVLGVEVALGIRLHGACSSNSRTICCPFGKKLNLWLWRRLVAPTSQWQTPHPCRNGAQSIIYPKQAWWISQKVWCLLKLSFAAWIFRRFEDHLYWSHVQSVPGNCKIRLQTLGKKEFVEKERTWYFRAEDSLFGCSTGNERLALNIASNHSGYKASRWKNWTLIYSIPCFA